MPSVSCQISSAVVLRWISGLAGFSNCCGMKERGSVAANSSVRLAMAPVMPFARRRQDQLGAEGLSSMRRSMLMVSGMVSTSL